ncbi:MAG: 4-hydroxy-tetrahydrodipicolinate synthase, partial [Candidatus Spechtbacterales bacterium]|nr:4-hydroxy-tetrahydrodipicolinate synthase [Candidatus Spechtbacterales bacterium]
MTNKKFSGLGTALITPFNETGDIDYDILTFLVRQQLKGGVDFLVPCGTTGESPTLSHREHLEVIEHTFYVTDNAVPILAGTGSNSTHEAVRLTREAKKLGADGSLAVAPYYNKPEPAGHRHYYESIAEVGLPVILYDIPGRTGRGVPTELIVDLANEGVIKGVKWASGDHNQLVDIINNTPEDFTVLSGDDAYTYGLLALGGNGAISVLSNLLPQEMSSMVQFGRDLSFSNALDLHNRYLP